MRRIKMAALAAVLAVVAALGFTAPAQATGTTPGTYTYYTFPSGTSSLTDVTFGTTVLSDPGRGNVYWSHQFAFTNNLTGYVGMQRWRTGTGQFLFSVWGATAAQAGDSGTYCQTFTEGSSGYTCRLNTAFTAGDTYTFDISSGASDGWYTATISDTTAGTSFVLGSVQVGSGAAISAGGMQDWVEYFDWNNNAATCTDEPYSRARFDAPTGTSSSGAQVTASISGTRNSTSCANVRIRTESTDTIHEDAIGNSPSGSITGIGGKCVDITGSSSTDGTPLELWTCNSGDNQNWVLANDGTVHAFFKCMTVNGTAVQLSTCNGSTTQQWKVNGGTLVNPATGKCLDATGASSANGTRLDIYLCNAGTNQHWSVPTTRSTLVSAASGRCLDDPGYNTANGTRIDIWDCNGGTNQQWTATASGNALTVAGKCLDAYGAGTTPGTPVDLWDCNGGTNQQWTVNSDGTIRGVGSGLCLDVTGGFTGNGTSVELWTCTGNTNQQWNRS